ncbi:MAG: hypothetical protein ACKVOU_00295 [Cytophagales bacterium]
MLKINTTFQKGGVSQDSNINSHQPSKSSTSLNAETKKGLSISDFLFLETQELLKDVNGSFSKELIIERRSDL